MSNTPHVERVARELTRNDVASMVIASKRPVNIETEIERLWPRHTTHAIVAIRAFIGGITDTEEMRDITATELQPKGTVTHVG